LGLSPLSRIHLKKPIVVVEECHAKKDDFRAPISEQVREAQVVINKIKYC
jgi:hypothetical protein